MTKPLLIAFLVAVTTLVSTRADAHPLGNYSINQYFLLDMRETPPVVYYLVDMAEIPSFTELDLLDTDFDSSVTDEETEKYLELKVPPLLAKLRMTQGGEARTLALQDRRLALLNGQGGMVIFHIVLKLVPETWSDGLLDFEIISENYLEESGVRECMLVLDNFFKDDTRSIGEEMLKYQTLVFIDPNKNPVYQDFDAGFTLRLAPPEGEPITGDRASRIAFDWTATAKTAEDMGETEMMSAMAKSVGDTPTDPIAAEQGPAASDSVNPGNVTAEISEPVLVAEGTLYSLTAMMATGALLFALGIALGVAIGRRRK